MSSQIGIIKGRKEVIQGRERKSYYEKESMFLTRFSGGEENGLMLQVTVGNSHIQLNEAQVRKLLSVLTDWKHAPELED